MIFLYSLFQYENEKRICVLKKRSLVLIELYFTYFYPHGTTKADLLPLAVLEICVKYFTLKRSRKNIMPKQGIKPATTRIVRFCHSTVEEV